MAKYLAMRISMGKLELSAVIEKYPQLETEIKDYLQNDYGVTDF